VELRARMRARRRALKDSHRQQFAAQFADGLLRSRLVQRSKRIACYLAVDGEMDPAPLIAQLWAQGKVVHLPVIHGKRLWFLPFAEDTPLVPNRFGILEPALPANQRCPPSALGLVLVPLSAFDRRGNRLGTGGGYYDRSFAFLRRRRHRSRPLLIGAAYAFQGGEELQPQPWDVPLNGVATEDGLDVWGPGV